MSTDLSKGLNMQLGIAAYLRNVAVRCSRLARNCSDPATHDALNALTAELTEKAEILEKIFRVPPDKL